MNTTKVINATLAGAMLLTSLVFAAGNAVAQSTGAVREDRAQRQADDAALARERAQLRRDESTLGADTRSGRMSATSADEEKVYRDRQAIRGETRDLARDKPGSLQERADRAALVREEARVKADATRWAADSRSGRMSAESPDAENVYRDQHAIKGEQNAIAGDRAQLKADRKK